MRTPRLFGPCVVGIDLSSRAIDIVRVQENDYTADWLSLPLHGLTAWDRTRDISRQMPTSSWFDDVYLCAIEKPFGPSRRGQAVLMRAQGAVLAAIPERIPVWEVTPDESRRHLGIPNARKPQWPDLPASLFDDYWSQDARDALAIALYARDVNAQGIARALEEAS